MAQVIQIKRSSSSAAPSSSLAAGELAYSGAGASHKLFIGHPDGSTGNIVIGGKVYVDMLDHTAGTLTASSALVVDSNSKIDVLNVDNLTLNGNSITSTDTNGNINITPNGNGAIILDGFQFPRNGDGSTGQFLRKNANGELEFAQFLVMSLLFLQILEVMILSVLVILLRLQVLRMRLRLQYRMIKFKLVL